MSPAEQMAKEKDQTVKTRERPELFTCDLRKLRSSLGLSMRDVQAGTGVPNATLHHAEQGFGVTLETAFKLAKFFGKSVEELWQLREE